MNGSETVPSLHTPLDPIPRILADPVFHHDNNTIHIVLQEYYLKDNPLDVYLGPIGPLKVSTWRSTAPGDKAATKAKALLAAIPLDSDNGENGEASNTSESRSKTVYSGFPGTIQHVLVVVDIPQPEMIMQVMKECAATKAQMNPQASAEDHRGVSGLLDQQAGDALTASAASALEIGDSWITGAGDLGADQSNTLGDGMEDDTMAIQKALKNAQEAFNQAQAAHGSSMVDQEIQGMMEIDPTLHDAAQPQQQQQDSRIFDTGVTSQQVDDSDNQDEPPAFTLEVPPREEKKVEFVPLPFLLIRSDGVGFGVGRSVVAEKLGGGDGSDPRWGEFVD